MLYREWGAESDGKLPHLFIPDKTGSLGSWVCGGRPAFGQKCNLGYWVCSEKPAFGHRTATLVPEFAVENLPLGRTATLVPEFAVKNLPLGRIAALVPEFAVEDLPLSRTTTLVPALAVKDLPSGRILWWRWCNTLFLLNVAKLGYPEISLFIHERERLSFIHCPGKK